MGRTPIEQPVDLGLVAGRNAAPTRSGRLDPVLLLAEEGQEGRAQQDEQGEGEHSQCQPA